MKHFSTKIGAWYLQNKRELPWRDTSDPYLVWLSEIILQQTRVDQGMAYYLRFSQEFPNVRMLAKAENEKVMKLWQGLGYYSRARNLHATAKIITKQYKGKFPSDYKDILSLKGVGEYTAAAIASFSFNKPYAVVDGNVYRVLSRIFGIETPIDSSTGKKEFSELADQLLDKKDPGKHNQAIMEFGAMFCKPVNPDCRSCIFQDKCYAFAKNKVAELPKKANKTKVRDRYFNYIVLKHKGLTAINKRTGKDIWTSLYDFPLIETKKEMTEMSFLNSSQWKTFIGKHKFSLGTISSPQKHILSHQKIYARFWEVRIGTDPGKVLPPSALVIRGKDIHKYPVPRLIENYLKRKENLSFNS